MPGSRASVFGEPEEFEDALRDDGVAGLLVTDRGQFRARLTQIALGHLRLCAVEEAQPRIASIAVPAGRDLVAFPIDRGPSPIWGAIEMRAGEMITLGPGQRVYARTAGPCYWGAIQLPTEDLARFGRILSGPRFSLPSVARLKPAPAAIRHLGHFHRAAIRMAEIRSRALTDAEAVHGLEQQLLDALIECLSGGRFDEEAPAARRHRDLLARFEDLLHAEPSLRIKDICMALAVSDRLLRECCEQHLGMSPSRYRHLRRVQQVHRALRSGNPGTATVSAIVGRYGIHDPGRFAASYRALYGESPSVTLRRGARGFSELSSLRRKMKFP